MKRIGDNAPTEEQIETTNPELRRLISTETYLEEESDMDRQVREQNTNRANKISYNTSGMCSNVMGRLAEHSILDTSQWEFFLSRCVTL